MAEFDVRPRHLVGALGAYALAAGSWNLTRNLFPEPTGIPEAVVLLAAGALLVEVVS